MTQDTDASTDSPLFSEEITDTTSTDNEQTSSTSNQTGGDDNSGENNKLIQKLQQEVAELREKLSRSQADYSNLVRRSQEEQTQIGEWSENTLLTKLLPLLDNLQRVVEHTPEEFRTHSWTEWLTSVIRGAEKTFTDLGVIKIESIGKEVNIDLHEVVSQTPSKEQTIQAEIESWYTRRGRTLRYAKVVVWDGTQV